VINNGINFKVVAVSAIAVLLLGAGWYRAHVELLNSNGKLVASTLEPAAALLKEDQALISELQTEPYSEKDSGILESYLVKIRRDGVGKHADMKERLDTLAENNTAIVTLINAYAPQARTTAFTTEGDKFRNYAAAWRDRWNSVMELFMAGGNYAASEVRIPRGFPDAVQAEIAASN
jgi:hypothetical protein